MLTLTGISGANTDMSITKEYFGAAGSMRLFVDKGNAPNLVGDSTAQVIITAAGATVAEFTRTVKVTGFILHRILQ